MATEEQILNLNDLNQLIHPTVSRKYGLPQQQLSKYTSSTPNVYTSTQTHTHKERRRDVEKGDAKKVNGHWKRKHVNLSFLALKVYTSKGKYIPHQKLDHLLEGIHIRDS